MFLIGTVGFILASALCGLAPNAGVLIAARLIQGGFAAMMLPQGFGILRETFPEDERQKAFALFGPVIGLSAVLRSAHRRLADQLEPVRLGLAAGLPGQRPDRRRRGARGLRLLPHVRARPHASGSISLGTALVARSPSARLPADPGPRARLAVVDLRLDGRRRGVAGGLRPPAAAPRRGGLDPLVTPSVFAHRGYSGGLVFAVLFFAGLGGTLLCSTLFLQIGQQFTPIHAALCTVPLTVGLVIGSGLSGGLLGPKFGRLDDPGRRARLRRRLGAGGARGAQPPRVGFVGPDARDCSSPASASASSSRRCSTSCWPRSPITRPDRPPACSTPAQQLATSIGIAVFGTIFFDAIVGGDFHSGLTRAMVVEVFAMVALLLISPLLPRFAREPRATAKKIIATRTQLI